MSNYTFAACDGCQSEGEIELPPLDTPGMLKCLNCDQPLTSICIAPWESYVNQRVDEFQQLQASGQLGTRRQAKSLSETEISRDGLAAELAACLMLCPGFRLDWWNARGNNRGRDLLNNWTQLPKPIEIKQTRYCDHRRGCLLVRPPRNTPGPMLPKYVDDSIYILMHGQQTLFSCLGWADRAHLLNAGELNPIPVFPGQRECWGMHWMLLKPLASLPEQMNSNTERRLV